MTEAVLPIRAAIRHAAGPHLRLVLLALATIAVSTLFMTLGARGSWDFILPFRGAKLATLALVGYAIAVSTVLFQTATGNRILTPALMGFDWLYMLIQTCLVFFLGSRFVASAPAHLMYAGELLLMIGFSGVLYQTVFGRRSLHLLVLIGVVMGVLFRSLSGFIQRLIDPNEFAFLQDKFFASFNSAGDTLLLISAVIIIAASIAAWRLAHAYDVLALGRDMAVNLGVNERRLTALTLIVVAVLVSVSTALVGPVTFFGLMVAHLAYAAAGSPRHRHILSAAVLIAIIALVGGQTILEHVFAFDTNLRVIVEFLGGLTLIVLLVRGAAR